jgi:uncharacterized protein (DUF952 family)
MKNDAGIKNDAGMKGEADMSVEKPFIVHLCSREDWQAAQKKGEYRPDSLDTEGFIHNSLPSQILWVANQFYRGEKDLVLLWIDPARVEAEIRWETVPDGTFPHVYGPLNLSAVVAVYDFPAGEDGVFRQVQGP